MRMESRGTGKPATGPQTRKPCYGIQKWREITDRCAEIGAAAAVDPGNSAVKITF